MFINNSVKDLGYIWHKKYVRNEAAITRSHLQQPATSPN